MNWKSPTFLKQRSTLLRAVVVAGILWTQFAPECVGCCSASQRLISGARFGGCCHSMTGSSPTATFGLTSGETSCACCPSDPKGQQCAMLGATHLPAGNPAGCVCQFEHVTLAQPPIVEARPIPQTPQWIVLADISVLKLSHVEQVRLNAEVFSPQPHDLQQRLASLCVWRK